MKKHIRKIENDNRIAIAPYNFVPLPDRVITLDPDKDKIDHARYANNRNTGQIDCKLTTETDLYIRSGLTASEFAASQQNAQPVDPPQRASLEELIAVLQTNPKNKPQFFSTTNSNQPVIPASSLRGMIRSLVEIASFSKVGWVSDNPQFFFRAVADNKRSIGIYYKNKIKNVQAGYVCKIGDKWVIFKAKVINGKNFCWYKPWNSLNDDIIREIGISMFNDNDFSIGYKPIYFDNPNFDEHRKFITDRISVRNNLNNKGFITNSGNMLETGEEGNSNRKNYCIIFEKSQEHKYTINDQAIYDYCNNLTEFQKLLGEKGCLINGRPIFFIEPTQEKGEVIYFGHSPNFRLAYRRDDLDKAVSALDCLPSEISSNLNIPDLAESIFGYVRQTKTNDQNRAAVNNSLSQEGEKKQALAGRVFFSNAHLSPEQGDVLKETHIPQILASPKPTTFQHYLVQIDPAQDQLAHYSTKGAVIRGRKLYWHQQPSNAYTTDIKQVEKAQTQYTCITPVNPGTTFEFTIRFENLSDVELGALLWVLDLASCAGKYRFKLGMGKPLGLGSVAINYELQLTDRKQRYQRLFARDGNWETGFEPSSQATQTKAIDAFCKFIDDNLGMDIEETEQIQQLRSLLAYRNGEGILFAGFSSGEDSALRYMEIERNTKMSFLPSQEDKKNKEAMINEYDDRRVLPKPSQVAPPPPRELPRPPIADDPIKVTVRRVTR
ncbi:MAG TPA: TIGR03986 family CRISPR-associated RAMP protein [Herpetosiphon sp.]|uniref:CRISPR type III-associated protein domain-containing protein n=1 Tax=Herpetosiphon aurantiacus (strain ATCC 23779 / DSM 785 / 114-95) TaxID=316274 RepID=A9AUN6_HERA2|nr:TIGR03986 family CRISPR-associated RAMP protein [Herpetosiphon sp.]ABX04563.1 hypothetical protein Haur_1920 [Herpetosiphon aurantiacus DSM 785]HBW50035.1 TIGR03986 family CRISPR-associated RAMP protein [Herpetosiphon sp.]